MGLPEIPKDFHIPKRRDVVTLKLAGIALMEQSLANLLETEVKILRKTVKDVKCKKASRKDLKKANRKAERVLRAIIAKEILLLFELEDTIDFLL
ncbi:MULTISPECIES: hypothetical protein [Neobacillus]|uniref:Uncharacterized protein n=1 Tax=Neobacillus rhizophilus TaxID=2833579 RepID=A0A942YUU5_9BACI|nr:MULTISPECIES: hypothetical protein [Neobacillus]MBS4213252.1 hypothetical protein [Neobacillus rhizophilus]MBU8914638.1 hypothetical protein [Bacillus sp. FJAT-29953]